MDAVFAILVLGAVIFFGAVISAGNEHQRKALEGIREQAAQWAMQDLRLKREKLVRELKVEDPVAWLNQVVAKVYGENLDLTVAEVFDNPKALVCTAKDSRKVVFSPASPDDIRRLTAKQMGKLSRVTNFHPLLKFSRKVEYLKLSILNAGVLFDLELPVVWKLVTGQDELDTDSLWLYI
jgi:hypothetical protein